VELQEFFQNHRQLTLLEPLSVDGNISLLELAVIGLLIRQARPQRIFEIGTFDGRTSINMMANAPIGCRLFTLDLPSDEAGKTQFRVAADDMKYIQKAVSGARIRGTEFEPNITQLLGDSATFDYKNYNGTFDVVFVDGSHAYDYVKSDTEVALRLLKPNGGLIVWHDYDTDWWPGVTRALNEFYSGRKELRGVRHVNGTALAYAFVK
jgi:predicted O-methyltransferase YrrM